MLAKLDNFGPFHIFYSLSCADMRWDENLTTIQEELGWKIIWKCKTSFDTAEEMEIFIETPTSTIPLKEFMDTSMDKSKTELLRTYIFISTRNFVRRVDVFLKNIILANNNDIRVQKWMWKVEFQGNYIGYH